MQCEVNLKQAQTVRNSVAGRETEILMFSIKCCVRIWIVLVTMVVCQGCGDGRSAPAPVTGMVTYKGRPVEGARVMFYPHGTRPAVGTTDVNGRFSLLTWAPGDGALEGESVVCIGKSKMVATTDSPYNEGISLLPEKYLAPSKSPLRARVTSAGPNEFSFALDD
jgi:hypothetical protein